MNDPYHINGLYVSQLSSTEREWLDWRIFLGKARLDYNTPAGVFLGLGKVVLL